MVTYTLTKRDKRQLYVNIALMCSGCFLLGALLEGGPGGRNVGFYAFMAGLQLLAWSAKTVLFRLDKERA